MEEYTMVKELKAESKLNKYISIYNFFGLMSGWIVSYLLSGLVVNQLQMVFTAYCIIGSVMLSWRSPVNPKKRVLHTLFFSAKKKNAYIPISVNKPAELNTLLNGKMIPTKDEWDFEHEDWSDDN